MSLQQLGNILLILSLITFVIFLITIIVYYWHSRKKSNNYLGNDEIELRYFIQMQVDYENKLLGYECLLRQHNNDDTWSLPKDLDSLPLQRIIPLLDETFSALPTKLLTLSINLEYDQINSPEFLYFVRWAISRIEPLQLAIEYSADKPLPPIDRYHFFKNIKQARAYGMLFQIDNVGSDKENYQNIKPLLPYVDTLKCSMKSFRKADKNIWLDLNLQFWNKLAKEKQINLVLMGIENNDDEKLAELLSIPGRQGYYFGRPMNPKERKDNLAR